MCMYIQYMYTCTMYMSCTRVQILVFAIMSACGGMDGYVKRLNVKWSVWGYKNSYYYCYFTREELSVVVCREEGLVVYDIN